MGNPVRTDLPLHPQDPRVGAENKSSEFSNLSPEKSTPFESRSITKAKSNFYARPPAAKGFLSSPASLGSSGILFAQAKDPRKVPPNESGHKIPSKRDKLSPMTRKIAKNLLQEGEKNYVSGKFEEALVAFQKNYELTQNPAFLYNIAQCHRQLLRIPEALKFFGDYLKAEPKAPNREEVTRIIKSLEKWEKLATDFPDEFRKLFIEFHRLADQFPEEGSEHYWPYYLSPPKGSETLACGSTNGREDLILAIMSQMTTLANDEDPTVVWAATLMLGDIALAFYGCRKGGKEAEVALSALEALTNHSRPEVRAEAAKALERTVSWVRRDESRVPIEKLFAPPPKLLSLLNDPASQVRVAAVTGLSQYRSGHELLELLKRENVSEVRGALAEALGSGLVHEDAFRHTPFDTDITKALIALAQENEWIAEKALSSLGTGIRRDPNGAWILIKALDHTEPLLRLRAANGLDYGAEHLTAAMKLEAIPKLKKISGNKLEGPCAAAALAKMGEVPYALIAFSGLAMSQDPEVRESLPFYLGYLAALTDRKGWIVPKEPVISILNRLLQDKDLNVQNRAKRALEEIKKEREMTATRIEPQIKSPLIPTRGGVPQKK